MVTKEDQNQGRNENLSSEDAHATDLTRALSHFCCGYDNIAEDSLKSSKDRKESSTLDSHFHKRFSFPKTSLTVKTPITTFPRIKISCIDILGEARSENTWVKRDLGFQGQFGRYVFLTYGDTLYSDCNGSDIWRGMTSDSVAMASHDPLSVHDIHLNEQAYPKQFCPTIKAFDEDPSTHALGITNVIETFPNQGIIYFLLNHRPTGINNLMGAGVATIQLDDTHFPPQLHLERLDKFWWNADEEPWYGDICALLWNNYIYAYGHAKDNPFVYLTRVLWHNATILDCYEYWNGLSWQKNRLYTRHLGEEQSVFWQINQGQVIWSNHFQCLLFIYCDNWMNSKVLIKTAIAPEGPWSESITAYQATPIMKGSSIYAAIPHPYYDESGKTMIITFTNHPNVIQAIKITFDGDENIVKPEC